MSGLPKLEDVFSDEVLKQLEVALSEIGEIIPWYDKEVSAWVFVHPLYPDVQAPGDTAEECIHRYKGWLAQFIQERMTGNITESVERLTSGRGGVRPGAGRRKGSARKPKTKMVRLPEDVACWIKQGDHLQQVQTLMLTS